MVHGADSDRSSRTLDGRTNTYSAQLMPWRSRTGNLVVALSNNAWQMDPLALDNPTMYQPRLFELAAAIVDAGAATVGHDGAAGIRAGESADPGSRYRVTVLTDRRRSVARYSWPAWWPMVPAPP